MAKRDYYEILGIGRDADEKEIKAAFRKLAKKLSEFYRVILIIYLQGIRQTHPETILEGSKNFDFVVERSFPYKDMKAKIKSLERGMIKGYAVAKLHPSQIKK